VLKASFGVVFAASLHEKDLLYTSQELLIHFMIHSGYVWFRQKMDTVCL